MLNIGRGNRREKMLISTININLSLNRSAQGVLEIVDITVDLPRNRSLNGDGRDRYYRALFPASY